MTTAISDKIRYAFDMKELDVKQLTDEALLTRISHGDEPAFDEFCRRHIKWAWHFDYQFLQNVQDTDDAVQEKFLRIWQKADTYVSTPEARVRSFLLKIDKNICIDMYRKSHRSKEIPFSNYNQCDLEGIEDLVDYLAFQSGYLTQQISPDQQTQSKELFKQIHDYTLNNFSNRQFLVFWGFITGMTYREIADSYDLKTGAVRGLIARGFSRIRKQFAASKDHQ